MRKALTLSLKKEITRKWNEQFPGMGKGAPMNVKKNKKWIAPVSAIAVIILILAVIGLGSGTKSETNAFPKGTFVSYE